MFPATLRKVFSFLFQNPVHSGNEKEPLDWPKLLEHKSWQ